MTKIIGEVEQRSNPFHCRGIRTPHLPFSKISIDEDNCDLNITVVNQDPGLPYIAERPTEYYAKEVVEKLRRGGIQSRYSLATNCYGDCIAEVRIDGRECTRAAQILDLYEEFKEKIHDAHWARVQKPLQDRTSYKSEFAHNLLNEKHNCTHQGDGKTRS